MAILSKNVGEYIEKIHFSTKSRKFRTFSNDPILRLADYCIDATDEARDVFGKDLINRAKERYNAEGIVGVVGGYFNDKIFRTDIEPELERKIVIMKTGLEALPATKAVLLFQGFGEDLSSEQIHRVYSSYGLSNKQKQHYSHLDFFELNRYFDGLRWVLKQGKDTMQSINDLYRSIRSYHYEEQTNKSRHIPLGMKKSLFYYHLNKVYEYGVMGLFPKRKGNIRQSKIGAGHEAFMVIDKIQHPERTESYYINYLKYNQIIVKRSVVNTIFRKWRVKEYKSAYLSNLKRLQTEAVTTSPQEEPEPATPQNRFVDQNFVRYLGGLKQQELHIDAPGLFVLWYYIEKLGLFAKLETLGLTKYENGHSWFDFVLFTIARIFYGIDTYQAGCSAEMPDIRFFASMIKTPCLSTFLSRLSQIDETALFELQKWLVKRLQTLGLSSGKQLVFDFNQIDLDVKHKKLRDFGSGPSPKKKICYSGFRPHIAWDADKGTLLVVEFRKSSARGTSTFARFNNDFLMPVFKDFFEEVYIDSEYTGKNVWNFILDKTAGMGADMVGCLKQNPLVKKERDRFLIENEHTDNFWMYWDATHVYSAKSFEIQWDIPKKTNVEPRSLKLNCVVKKNIKNGKYRCFGSSHIENPRQILEAYSNRWGVENAIKDLIHSYFLDKPPSVENPLLVNTHFFIVTLCKTLYRMLQEDMGSDIKNKDGSIKTLKTMRNKLFRQGVAKLFIENKTIKVELKNSLSSNTTQILQNLFQRTKLSEQKMKIIGDFNLDIKLAQPTEKVMKNSGNPQILNSKNF